jgi:3-hydroxyethyl bacteriochlorophyllide a dehydrogenase
VHTLAVVIDQPRAVTLRSLLLTPRAPGDVLVETEWTGISSGTERLLWDGRMPDFPGMGYPLVPGYEAVGRVVEADTGSTRRVGERVFVAGARCYGTTRGLFGGSASHLVVPGERAVPVDEALGMDSVLLALAATAYHAAWGSGGQPPELIVGHGALGRLLARLTIALGCPAPTVWERDERRLAGGAGYRVLQPSDDPRRDYRSVYDVSGDAALLDELVRRLAVGGEVVLAGFYHQRIGFDFVPAFLHQLRLRIAAEWGASDLERVAELAASRRLSLDGIVTHCERYDQAMAAYPVAFTDPGCVKMVLDWRLSA